MFELVFAVVALVVLAYGFVVAFGAPYLPTLKPQIEAALDLLDLKSGQTMLEIGSGDGRVLAAAAERGWHATGYELNPILVLWSRFKTRKYKGRVQVVWGDAFRKKWPVTDGIFIFGLDKLMPKVYTKIVQSSTREVRLASVAFTVPGVKTDLQKDGVFLYNISPRQYGKAKHIAK